MSNKWGGLLVGMFLFFAGCTEEPTEVEAAPTVTVAVELQPYFEDFEALAASYGRDVSAIIVGVSGNLETLENNIAGQCTSFSNGVGNTVRIDTEFWEQAHSTLREFVVFHELGHCVLGRGHLNTQTPDGRCVSIMHSGETDCRNVYGPLTRSDYLEELFSE